MSALTCEQCGKPHPEFVEACDCALRARVAELRWVLNGEIGAPPTATDLLEAAEGRLRDPDEMSCCSMDCRLAQLNNVRALVV